MDPCVNIHSWLKMVSWTIVKDVFVCKDGFVGKKKNVCV